MCCAEPVLIENIGYGLDINRRPRRLPRGRRGLPAVAPGAEHHPARGGGNLARPRRRGVRGYRAAVRLGAPGPRRDPPPPPPPPPLPGFAPPAARASREPAGRG